MPDPARLSLPSPASGAWEPPFFILLDGTHAQESGHLGSALCLAQG